MKKVQKLIRLRNKIVDEIYKRRWEEVWFFPQYKEVSGVKGFLGTMPIMFVSINPSFGAYPSKADLFYYRNLKRQGFGNAHLTDVFKIKRRSLDSHLLEKDYILMKEAEKYLAAEINIIRPRLIIGVSLSYENFYRKIFAKYKTPIEPIPHYAPRFANQKTRKRFRAAMRRVRRRWKVMQKIDETQTETPK